MVVGNSTPVGFCAGRLARDLSSRGGARADRVVCWRHACASELWGFPSLSGYYYQRHGRGEPGGGVRAWRTWGMARCKIRRRICRKSTGRMIPISRPNRIVHWDAEWHWDADLHTISAPGVGRAHRGPWADERLPNLGGIHLSRFSIGRGSRVALPGLRICSIWMTAFLRASIVASLWNIRSKWRWGHVILSRKIWPGAIRPCCAYYRLLNCGFRPGSPAGSDYPCNPTIGQTLTYVQVAGRR